MRWSIGLNMLLATALAAVLLREGYPHKLYHAVFPGPERVERNRPYLDRVADHKAAMDQLRQHGAVQIGFAGDSIIAHWVVSGNVDRTINLGIPGDTTGGLLRRLRTLDLGGVPIWYVGIGINDIAYGVPVDRTVAQSGDLMALFGAAGTTLYWRALLPVATDTWSAADEAARQAINTRTRALCDAAAYCTYLEPPPAFVADPARLTSDGLHPNARGYGILLRQLCALVQCAVPDR